MCGALSSNRIAADDNPMKLMSIAMNPIGHPPFPIERLRTFSAVIFNAVLGWYLMTGKFNGENINDK